jgi:hypothetical protein
MEKTENVPAIQKAVATLTNFKNKGMTFARREDLESVSQQFQPLVTIVEFQGQDFTDVGMGNMYPGKSATNRIGDAAGVSFIEGVGGTREEGSMSSLKVVKTEGGYFQVEGHYIVIGSAQGERLKPDGTPRRSSVCEYGFDVVNRTNLDIVNDQKKAANERKLESELACRGQLLTNQKFAVQRARTGAELAVIRELVGMPTAFKKGQVAEGCQMLFSQVIENNTFKVAVLAEVMKTPDGRAAVTQALFGQSRSVFGPGGPQPAISVEPVRQLTGGDGSEIEPEPAPAAQPIPHTVDPQTGEMLQPPPQAELSPSKDDFSDDIPWDSAEEVLGKLKRCLEIKKLHPHARFEIEKILKVEKPELKDLEALLARTVKWLTTAKIDIPWAGELPGLSGGVR